MRGLLGLTVVLLSASWLGCGTGAEGEVEPRPVGDSQACLRRTSQALTVCAKNENKVEGVDISAWQGDVDWKAVAGDGMKFGIVRVSDGLNYPDAYFQANWKATKEAGLIRGVYQFFRPTQDPIAQADLLLDALDAAGGLSDTDLPPVLDLEDDDGVDPAAYQAGAKQWLDYVESKTGRRPIVYSALFFSEFIGDAFLDYPLWVANYKSSFDGCPSVPDGFTEWKIWQWTDSNKVSGVDGGVDSNVFDGTLDELKAFIASTVLTSHDDAGVPDGDAGTNEPPSDPTSPPVMEEPEGSGAGAGKPPEGSAMGAGDTCREDDVDDSTAEDDDPISDGGGDKGCPVATAPAMLTSDPAYYCPPGSSYDATYRLCVTATEAIGPFTDSMIATCNACGGQACDENTWPADQARGIRGTASCPPGSSLIASGLCVDDKSAWGPFSPARVERCITAGGGEGACRSMRWDRKFAETLAAQDPPTDKPPSENGSLPWSYILDINYGVRGDSLGGGSFGSARSGNAGGHSGIDFLAPVGSALLAPCAGDAESGEASGYGNYVKLVCPLPSAIAAGGTYFASIFFAHLSSLDIAGSESVTQGQRVGAVGKTGNAASAGIGPHVHFEITIHGSEADAWNESHASSNHGSNTAADAFFETFDDTCLTPRALMPLSGPVHKGRRPDPFLLLACLAGERPALTDPPMSLQDHTEAWSDHYSANFDVDSAS